MKINIYQIWAILFFQGVIIRIQYITNFTRFEQICVLLAFFIVVIDFVKKYRKFNKYKYANICLLCFSVCVFISALYNKYTSANDTILVSIVYIMQLVCIFLGLEVIEIKGRIREVLKIFFYMTLGYIIVSDLLMLLVPSLYIRHGELYFVGNKFTISSLHLLLFILYQLVHKKMRKVIEIILMIWAIAVTLYTNCITGLVGCLIVVILNCFPKELKKKSTLPSINAIILGVSSTILFFFEGILQISFVQNLIINVFEKEQTINSRMMIYKNIFEVINRSKIWGYGFQNSYSVLMHDIGAPNAQNSVLDSIIQYGFAGTIALLILMWLIIKYINKKYVDEAFPFFSLVIVAFLTACVEITFSRMTFIYLVMAMVICFHQRSQMKNE